MKIRILTIVFLFVSYQGFSQEIKNYAEAKSVVMAYLDTLKTLQITDIKKRTSRKYKVFGGKLKGLHYRKKVKKIKSGQLREDISIFNDNTMIGHVILFNNEIFYASVWYKASSTKTDVLTLTKDEFITSPFIESNNLNLNYHKLK